ncbi:MAG: 16S rRNA (cytidine(1402)-2'-O)-methyltransferase [Christensenellales bacterium]|jgi:16S rRNA (cytidine1402-2'-O)-methyltransferase
MLYIVGLPIGNLKDITLRALETLQSVDFIACEDTRKTLILLNHYSIKKPLIAYHKFNEQQKSEEIVKLLLQGKTGALVSDSGMPLISDPGQILISKLIENNLKYTVIPGPTASISALVLSGLSLQAFCFLGFLPEKQSARKKLLNIYKNLPSTLVFYISPHSLEKDIAAIYEIFGARKAVLVKEITKVFETAYHFVLGQEIDINEKGEFVLVVEGKQEANEEQTPQDEASLKDLVEKKMQTEGITENQAIALVAKENNIKKQELYKLLKAK